jgi:hypothetical protein
LNGFGAEQLKHQGKQISCSSLFNEENKHCGVIMDFESSISKPSSIGPYEMILLSRSVRREHSPETWRPALNTMHPPGTPIWDGERFVWDELVEDFDAKHFEDGPWKMLNVMIIRWHGDYAERVAIARIHEDACLELKPVRKDIVLR